MLVKKVLCILLLFLLLGLSGSYFLFVGYLKSQKREFRRLSLQQNHIAHRQLSLDRSWYLQNANGLEWKEEGKELLVGSKYYEVLKAEFNGAQVILTLIPDKEESRLFSTYLGLQNVDPFSLPGILFQLISLLFLSLTAVSSPLPLYLGILLRKPHLLELTERYTPVRQRPPAPVN